MAALLALSAAVAYGVGDFLGGVAARRVPPTAVVLWSHVVGLVMLVALAPVARRRHHPRGPWPSGRAAGLLGGGGVALFYRGLSVGAMSVVAPVAALLSAAVPVVVGLAGGRTADHRGPRRHRPGPRRRGPDLPRAGRRPPRPPCGGRHSRWPSPPAWRSACSSWRSTRRATASASGRWWRPAWPRSPSSPGSARRASRHRACRVARPGPPSGAACSTPPPTSSTYWPSTTASCPWCRCSRPSTPPARSSSPATSWVSTSRASSGRAWGGRGGRRAHRRLSGRRQIAAPGLVVRSPRLRCRPMALPTPAADTHRRRHGGVVGHRPRDRPPARRAGPRADARGPAAGAAAGSGRRGRRRPHGVRAEVVAADLTDAGARTAYPRRRRATPGWSRRSWSTQPG